MKTHKERIANLQLRMRERNIDGFILAQNTDVFYLTGSMQNGFLFVPALGEAVFYVRKSAARAAEESAVNVRQLGSLKVFAAELAAEYPQVFGTERIGRKPVIAAEYDVLPIAMLERLRTAMPDVEWTDGSRLIRELRMIKTPDEVAHMRQAARLVDQALTEALAELTEGMTEIELLARIEYRLRSVGHLGVMRTRGFNQELVTGMLGAGAAAAKPSFFDGPAGGEGLDAANPQSAGTRPISRNEPILLDIGCCVGGYVIDQTRTAVIGALPDDLAQAYAAAEDILRETESQLRPGTLCSALYAQALEGAERAGLGDHFMGCGADQAKFLGHGIGLEIDELPVLAKGFDIPLEAGMVIAVEPKFTFPGRGVVGIENSYLITEDGFEKLTVTREGVMELI